MKRETLSYCTLSYSALKSALMVLAALSHVQQPLNAREAREIDRKIVATALTNIKRSIEETKKASQTPHIISCELQLQGDKLLTAQTETHVKEYHQGVRTRKSGSRSTVAGKPTRVVEVVYRPAVKGTVALIERDPARTTRRLAVRNVAIGARAL